MNINEYLSKFYKGTKTPTLDAMKFFMEKLGYPDKKLKIVHIAGTNGKGSVTEMLSTVLEKAGYKVGEFMTPHIIRYNERIALNKTVYSIGKDVNHADYCIMDNSAISRMHANIISRGEEYFVVDNNSTNHTYVNGMMIPSNVEVQIINGARIHFADEEFEFRVE